jgi:hypothetical protein
MEPRWRAYGPLGLRGRRCRRQGKAIVVRWLIFPVAATVAGVGCSQGSTSATPRDWRAPLAGNVALDPNSTDLVSKFNHQWKTFYGSVGINTDAFSIPIYTVPASQPRVSVAISPGCYMDPALLSQFRSVPIPANARPANGTDRALVVWQPSTDTDWELWGAQPLPDGSWTMCWGGQITKVSRSNGVFQRPYGLSATGLSYLASTIRVSELQAGRIRHTLAVGLIETSAGVQVSPANRNDGNSTSADAIPEGTRFRLDPTLDVTRLRLPPAGVTIAKALQTYGMVVTDTSGAVVLMAEDRQPYLASGAGDPYASVFGSTPSYAILSKIPWNRLEAIRPSRG